MAHILIIDDDQPIRMMLCKMLESEGYEVTEAADGAEGIKRFHEQQIDLIITDIIMPEKEGTETIIELKKENPEVKIIAMSGGGKNRPDGYLQTAKMLGAQKTLVKPVRKKDLLDAIRSLL